MSKRRWTVACYWTMDVYLVPKREAFAIYCYREHKVIAWVPDTGQDARVVRRQWEQQRATP